MTDFSWLAAEVGKVANRSFHRFEECPEHDLQSFMRAHFELPADYLEFARQYGSANLFRDPQSNWHRMRVFAPPKLFPVHETRGQLLQIGYYLETGHVYYLVRDGCIVESGSVFRGDNPPIRKIANSFQLWLASTFKRARKEYPKSEWGPMTECPPAFDDRERGILNAIPKFNVRKLGTTQDGNVLFEVENHSSTVLPRLSIGLRWERLEGGVFLPTDDILPGEKKVIEMACYKGAVDPEKLEVFSLPLPTPEDRRYYREFGERRLE